MDKPAKKPNVVIIGGGFGDLRAANLLRKVVSSFFVWFNTELPFCLCLNSASTNMERLVKIEIFIFNRSNDRWFNQERQYLCQ